jgi:hypothetical protein
MSFTPCWYRRPNLNERRLAWKAIVGALPLSLYLHSDLWSAFPGKPEVEPPQRVFSTFRQNLHPDGGLLVSRCVRGGIDIVSGEQVDVRGERQIDLLRLHAIRHQHLHL